MKALKEIGVLMYGTPSFIDRPNPDEYFGALFAWREGAETYTHPVIVMTGEERCELVRRVWSEALKSIMRIDDPYEDERKLNNFIKDEGL